MEKITKNTILIRKMGPIFEEKANLILAKINRELSMREDLNPAIVNETINQALQGAMFTAFQETMKELIFDLGQDFYQKEVE